MIRTSHDTARTKLGAFPCQDDFRSYGGTCNNQENADWGSYNKALKRIGSGKFDPAFLPGTNDFPADGMPNPRIVSRILFRQSSSRLSVRQVTSMAVFWGQFIDHDIGLTPDSGKTVFEERMDIDIVEKEDPFHFRHGGKLEFARSRGVLDGKACCGIGIAERFPRDPINLQSSFIDASHVYGCHRERLKPLRTFKDGQLRVGLTHENGEHLLPKNAVSEIGRKVENAQSSSDNHFVAGDIRANEQPVLTSLHTLFMREHNRLARMLVESFPCWQDEKVFQYSRKIVASQIQQLTYRFFIPALLGRRHGLRQYRGYHNNVDPSIANFFSTCAFRFGHSMVPETLTLLETGRRAHSKSGTTLQSVFFDPSFITEIGIEALLLGASHQVAESVDCQIVDSLQNELFKNATGGVDLVSINIQRGRDHGIPKYNDAREMYGLRRKRSFEEVTSNHTLAQILSSLYTSVNEMDSFVGGLAEDHIEDSELGELFHTAVRDQFTRLRDGDRFFYKNTDWPLDMANFKPVEELNRESLTIQDIIARNSGGALRKEDFDENVFQKA
ncbi:Animal heme peroxidase homologue [Chondrus crispus]|uniref:Animal heme peroxidase homologue n=1 Tax=Chondrus crispus TaxID=2769 RepID=R7Q6H1_CHOCR|nr:Animal heme peroxidase homologue [Chondrus crispus]CDF33619.1 Animal heme peroxidase homologue [Chondrus crispus]|eukprot:XP_005713422.1 Animal heme peroxidase homologue [Chondrus crispus]